MIMVNKIATIFLLCCVSVFVGSDVVASENYYKGWYENIDVEPILRNDKLLSNYIKCFMGESACTSDQRSVLKMVPELKETVFSKCTPKQKAMARRAMRYVYDNRPDDFTRLADRFDPTREYYDRIVAFMKETPAK